MDERTFQQILTAGINYGASDIHFKVGMAPMLRVSKELNWIKAPKLTKEDTETVAKLLLSHAAYKDEPDKSEIDMSYEIPEVGRFRVNIFQQMGRYSVIMRIIPYKIPTFADLNLPPSISQLANYERGLILVTGAAGNGKTSTMTAIINQINNEKKRHIITIEDPVEFVHKDMKSSVTQREVGLDTRNFTIALRASLRQDPDIIVVGEMRDYETIDVALKAAETGHLVISSVHTIDAAKTINRLLSVFPPNEQEAVRFRLAESLMAIISQRLLPSKDGKGMVVACEIMFSTLSIKECICIPEKFHLLHDYIEKGKELLGMQSFDQHLAELYRSGKLSLEVAKSASSNPSDFERSLLLE
jgi:twitching motility protein PilT